MLCGWHLGEGCCLGTELSLAVVLQYDFWMNLIESCIAFSMLLWVKPDLFIYLFQIFMPWTFNKF